MLVSRILKLKKLQSENAILRKKISRHYRHRDIITKNPRMEEILALTREIASIRSTVLIGGDSEPVRNWWRAPFTTPESVGKSDLSV